MENNIEKAEVREMIRQFSAEFSSLLATRPGSTAGGAAAIAVWIKDFVSSFSRFL